MTTTTTTRIITLTDRPPVRIREGEWPIIASADADSGEGYYHDQARHEQARNRGELTRYVVAVRQHQDGRAIVYAVVRASIYDDPDVDRREGEFLPAGADLAAAIRRVGERAGIPDRMIRACIADLPAEEL